MTPCSFTARARAEYVVTSAFLQACREHGIPPHPGGECPSPDCRCAELGDRIEARAVEIAAGELGISPAELGGGT
jgi:hypothetical protein